MRNFLHFLFHTPAGLAVFVSCMIILLLEFKRLFKAKFKWEPRDTWLGLFHDKVDSVKHYHIDGRVSVHHKFRLFLVVVPCLPLIWDWIVTTKHINEGVADKAVRAKKTLFHFLLFWQ